MNRMTVKSAADKAAYEMAAYLAGEIRAYGRPFNIALSGGNSPKVVFRELAGLINKPSVFKNIHFYWVDERCVPVESEESNFGEFKRIFADKLNFPDSNMHPMIGTNNPEEEARRYSEMLRKNLPLKNDTPVFDILVLGMGDDGHTASIFPDQMHLFTTEELAASARHPQTKQNRITLTGRTILNAAEVLALVTGQNKSRLLKTVLERRPESMQYPIAHVYRNQDIFWFLDEAATENF